MNDCREFEFKRKGGLGQAISNNPSIPWSKRSAVYRYTVRYAAANNDDKKSVLTMIQKTPPHSRIRNGRANSRRDVVREDKEVVVKLLLLVL